MIFSSCRLFFAGGITYKLLVAIQGVTDEEKEKSMDNEGPSITEEVHFFNNTVDCWKIWLYTSLANYVKKASVVSEVKEGQN